MQRAKRNFASLELSRLSARKSAHVFAPIGQPQRSPVRRTYHPSADSPQKRKTTVNGCISQEIPPEAERMEDRTINGNSAGTTAEYHKRSPAAAPFVTRPA